MDLGPANLNLSWVTPTLALGGHFPMQSAFELVDRLRIRHIVDLRIEAKDDERVLEAHGIQLLHLPTEDACAVSAEMIDEGVAWVSAQLDAGSAVYIHCEHGIGRSALLAVCVLVFRGHPPLQALGLAKDARPVVSPSPAQLEAFIAWCARHRSARGLDWTVPRFEALAQIAYRHLQTRSG